MKQFILLMVILITSCNNSNKNDAMVIEGEEEQFIKVDVKKKIYDQNGSRYGDYKTYDTRIAQNLVGYKKPAQQYEESKYGGWKKYQESPTGFFHTKKIGDRWWGIDPDGYRYINIALNSINKGVSENNKKAFQDKFGSTEVWIKETIQMLQENGFNSAGSWSDTKAIREANKTLEKPLSYTINWNFMSAYGKKRGGTFQVPGHTGFPKATIFVFDPDFEQFVQERALLLKETKDDPNLFGHFSDNELPFKDNALDNYLSLDKDDYGRKAAEKFLEDKGIGLEEITDNVRQEFLALVAEKYFSIVSSAIKRNDPNHLFLGSRFYSSEKNHKAFITEAGKYIDVLSFNYYGAWTPSKEKMQDWENWSGKPFLVTEYYAKGEDSGLPNKSGAGFLVKTQRERGYFYQNFNLGLLESSSCIGWHYFKYQDNDPTQKDAEPSNIDSNKGIVDLNYEPWTEMMTEMYEINHQVYPLIEHFHCIE